MTSLNPCVVTPVALVPVADIQAAVRFTVHAQLEPSVLSRVLELFVLRDIIPAKLSCHRDDDARRLLIHIESADLAADKIDHLAERIRQFPTVLSVLIG